MRLLRKILRAALLSFFALLTIVVVFFLYNYGPLFYEVYLREHS